MQSRSIFKVNEAENVSHSDPILISMHSIHQQVGHRPWNGG